MKQGMLHLLQSALLWLPLALAPDAGQAIVHANDVVVAGDRQLFPLSGQLATLEDPDRKLNPLALLGDRTQSDWQDTGRRGLNQGPTRARWWLRADLHNTDSVPRERIILVHQPTLEDVHFYLSCPGMPLVEQQTGTRVPFAFQPVRDQRPAVRFTLPAGTHCIGLFSVHTTTTVQFPATLADLDTFAELQQRDLLWRSLVLGMQMLLVIVGLGLTLVRRRWSPAGYTALVSAQTLVVLALSGLGYRFLWGGIPLLQVAMVPLSIALAWHCTALFSLRVLPRRTLSPSGLFSLWITIAAAWTAAVTQALMPDARAMSVLVTSVALGMAILLLANLQALFARTETAGYATAAISIVSAAALAESAGFLGLYSLGEYFLLPLQLGFLLQGLLLVGALWKTQVVDTPRSGPAVITDREVRRQVAERTRELSATVASLSAANEKLDRLSSTDALTGVYNRRYMDQCLRNASGRDREALISFILFDIDHFKAVNDRYGHAVGDRCLREVTDCVRTQLRQPGDILCRYGGEEFAVILPDTDLEGATAVAEKIRQAVEQNPIHLSGTEVLRVTVSLGVTATMNGDIPLMVEDADKALYEAKRSGRNRWLASGNNRQDFSQLRTSVNPNSSIH